MKIVVLLKSPRTSPDSDETFSGLGPGDRAALGTAVALATDQDEIIALTAGPEADEKALHAAQAAGVQRAVRVTDPLIKNADQRTTATVLAGGLRKIGFDLVLVGHRSSNWATGGTGPAVAHLLRLPHVTSVTSVQRCSPDNSADWELLVTHRRERIAIDVRVRPPAVLATLAGPPLPTRDAAAGAVEPLSLAEMTLPFRKPLVSTGREIVPVEIPRAKMLDGVEGLVALLEPRR